MAAPHRSRSRLTCPAALALTAAACQGPPPPDYPTRRVDNPHYVGDVRQTGVEPAAGQDPRAAEQAILRRVGVRAVDPPPSSRWRLTTASPDDRFIAYVVHAPRPRLFVHEPGAGETVTLDGLPGEPAPLIELRWLDDATLGFERWSESGAGIAYAFDAARRRMTRARPISSTGF